MNNHALRNIQYLFYLSHAETARIHELMEPFLGGEQPLSRRALEQLIVVLGEFGARVGVIEQAAEQQLLADSPFVSGPLLFGSLELGSGEILDDSMCRAVPEDDGRYFRWTTRPELTVELPLFRTGAQTLQIFFKAIIKPEYAKTLKIAIDGMDVPHRVKNTEKGLCLTCRIPRPRNLAMTEVRTVLPAVHSPKELGASDDRRNLGIAIREIVVSDGASSLLQRLLGY